MQYNRLVATKWGMMCINSLDQNIGKLLMAYGEFSRGEVDLFSAIIKPDDICLDVGANIGAITLPIASMCRMVLAFEPQESIYHLLCANLALNSISNVRALQFAVSDNREPMMIPVLDPRIPNNFGGIDLRTPSPSRQQVQTITIDDLQLPACGFIKIDVEGMEPSVLIGAEQTISRFRPIIYLENDRPENETAISSLLSRMNYRTFDHFPPLFSKDNFRRFPVNLFENIASLNLMAWPEERPFHVELLKFELLPRGSSEDPHATSANGQPPSASVPQ